MAFERTSEQAFFNVSALLFALSAALTTVWCRSMSDMGAMPMPGGWKMSMAWMRMPGQSWAEAAASFLAMWIVMMVAMMMPSLVPALWRYRKVVGRTGETRLPWLTTLAGLGYFFVWAVIGVAVFVLGVALAGIEMESPALARTVPVAGRCGGPDRRRRSSSRRGRRITLPAGARHRGTTTRCLQMPVQLGDMA